MKNKSRILLIYTGGTIGMMQDSRSGSLKPFDFEHIQDQVSELIRFNAELEVHSFETLYDSSNMQPEIWQQIAEKIYTNYESFDGFVVLHGSDTMAYTASALSFMLENLSKPVIFTGSQLPIGEIRTDAKENLITAIEIATDPSSPVREVCILFDYALYRGNRATKYSSEKFQAFRSVNYPVLAEAGVTIKYHSPFCLPVNGLKLQFSKALDTNIVLIKLYPGISMNAVHSMVNVPGLKAIILETFGAGNASTKPEFIQLIKNAIESGIIVYDISQCPGGRVELGKYETSAKLKEIGVISGSDITTEAAVCKMMYLLGKNLNKDTLRKQLESSLRGELTESVNQSY